MVRKKMLWCIFSYRKQRHHTNKNSISGFPLSEEFINKCQQRIDDYYDDYNEMCDKFNSAQEDNYYENSYGRYAGSYVQDEMGYSDDNIDTIFDGAPDAYWNID